MELDRRRSVFEVPSIRTMRLSCILVLLGFACLCLLSAATPSPRLRLIVETDAGGDPDDEQSLVRFLLYANEWDVEGIIANRASARPGENRNSERTGLDIVRALVRAYGQCHSNLVQHDDRYPAVERLLDRTVPGYDDTDAAVNLILRSVDAVDSRPLWYADWGSDHGSATNNLRRALDRVRRERGTAGYARFKNRLRLVSADAFAEHTLLIDPPWRLWVSTFEPELDGRRWYHRFSAITASAGGFDLDRDLLTGHGPLGALYPTNTTHRQKEGDTMTFLYLVPNGLSDPEEPTWGGWAGRYGLRGGEAAGRPYYWANQADLWEGSSHRDHTLARWAVHLQNDFRARLDWCVQPLAQANHPPRVVLNEVYGTAVLRVAARAGSTLDLDASRTTDPDGDRLTFTWQVYPEAGTCRHPVSVTATAAGPAPQADATEPTADRVQVHIPPDAAGETIHVVLAVTDAGSPPLTRYRRAVIEVTDRAAAGRMIAPFCQPPAEFAGQFGSYRSPLRFADGRRVASAAEWPDRRLEIEQAWHRLLGPWPPPIEHPRIEALSEETRDNFRQQRIRLEIAPNQNTEAWLLTPSGRGPFPAVLVVYYDPDTSVGLNPDQPGRDFGLRLARRGFVTLNVGTPGGDAWAPDTHHASCQPLAFCAYVAANCWRALAGLPQVDPQRIGVTGHSYGGKWALFAAAFWNRFAAVAVSDPGVVFDETRPNVNYWEPWYLGADVAHPRLRPGVPSADNPPTGAYRLLVEQGRDLTELHALIAPRPFLVSGGSEDPPARWVALNHLVELNRLLGHMNRVALTSRPDHPPTPESNAQLLAFFEHFL